MLQNELFGEMEGLLNEARSRIEGAKQSEKRVHSSMIQARSDLDRVTRDKSRVQLLFQDARSSEANARERAAVALRNAEEAKYKETPQTRRQAEFRYNNESRRWLTEADQMSRGVRRWEDESLVKDRQIQIASEKIESLERDLEDRRREVHDWEQRVLRLGQLVGRV